MAYKPSSTKQSPKNPYAKKSPLRDPRRQGYIAGAILVLVLLVVFSSTIIRAVFPQTPIVFTTMNMAKLEETLKFTKKLSSIVVIYDANCLPCKNQIRALAPLLPRVHSGEIDFVLISFDDKPDAAADYLKSLELPEEITPYYTLPTERAQIIGALHSYGARSAKGAPFTALFDNRGSLIAEYTTLVSAQQIDSVLKIFTMRKG